SSLIVLAITIIRPPLSSLLPYTTLFRSRVSLAVFDPARAPGPVAALPRPSQQGDRAESAHVPEHRENPSQEHLPQGRRPVARTGHRARAPAHGPRRAAPAAQRVRPSVPENPRRRVPHPAGQLRRAPRSKRA